MNYKGTKFPLQKGLQKALKSRKEMKNIQGIQAIKM